MLSQDIPQSSTKSQSQSQSTEQCSSGSLMNRIINKYGYGYITFISILCLFFTMMVEGIEFSLFSVYLIPLTAYFSFTSRQIQLISSSMFISIGFGSFLSGYISERFNRIKPIKCLFFLVLISHFGMYIINNIVSFAIFRNLIGFLIGVIIPIQFNITAEYLPVKLRSFCMSTMWIAWNIGQMINSFLMWVYMPNLEQESMVICMNRMEIVCIGAFAFNMIFLEDSPRNIIMKSGGSYTNDQVTIAYEILSKMHGKALTDEERCVINHQVTQAKQSMQGDLIEAFNSKYKATTIILSFLWFINSMISYGLLLVYSLILRDILTSASSASAIGGENTNSTSSMNNEIVWNNTFTSIALLPSCLFAGIMSEVPCLGRKMAMLIGNLIPLITIYISICNPSHIYIWFSVSCTFISISYTILNSYSAEVYSTVIRDKALGVLFAMARIGGFLSQVIFIELHQVSLFTPFYFSMAVSFICVILIYCLPYETYNMPLDEIEEDTKTDRKSDSNDEDNEDQVMITPDDEHMPLKG